MRPLEDVRIVALEQYGAGPFGTWHLAELGAEVIKLEDPRVGGDVGRTIPPYVDGEDSLFFETFNRGKRSLSLDLTTREGREVFEDLVRVSDAVYSNLRGDVPEQLRIRYDDLKDVNPAIVCCSLTGFGMTGPRRAEPGYDYVLQGLCGWMSMTGEPDGPPTRSGLSLVDYSGGYVAALALVAGVHAARRDGVGLDCDVSLFDTAIAMLSYLATWHLSEGYEPTRVAASAHPTIVPFQNFRTSDGWIVVACAKEKFWRRVVDAVGRPDLANDDRFATFAGRLARRDELLEQLSAAFAGKSTADWLVALTAAGVPCAPVNDVAAALRDPQTVARDMVVEFDHPAFGRVRAPASPVRVGEPQREHRRAPSRNEDADYVLSELLGYDRRRIARLMSGSDDR